MATSRAEKIPMRIQNREEKSEFYSIVNSHWYFFLRVPSSHDVPVTNRTDVEAVILPTLGAYVSAFLRRGRQPEVSCFLF